jgi:thiol-disulfide isomerase/thioredoxin
MKFVIGLILMFVAGITSASSQSSQAYNPVLARSFDRFFNNTFPVLELETEDSTRINTASLAGKTIYVDCWFTTCPPCIKEIPYSFALQQYFAADTNIVFLNICIENIERKQAWKEIIKAKRLTGVNVFYARNSPQKVNLLRQLGIDDFPTYLLVNKGKIVGHNAPAPSEKGFVQWAIYQARNNIKLSDAYTSLAKRTTPAVNYLNENRQAIEALTPK